MMATAPCSAAKDAIQMLLPARIRIAVQSLKAACAIADSRSQEW